eukprot:513258-Pelagomonas_calceolata.AAC.1
MATVRVMGSELSQHDLAAMQKLPDFEVSFKMPMPTLLGALRRTDLLPSDSACVAATTKAQDATAHVLEAGGSPTPAPDVPAQHATQDRPSAPEPSLFGLEDASVFVAAKYTPEPPPPVFDTA